MKRFSLLVVTIVVAATMAILAAQAGAASPSQADCEAQGGTFQRQNGQVTCVIVDEGKNPKFTDTNTTSGQGNTSNKQQQSDTCGGTGSGKCPGGQF